MRLDAGDAGQRAELGSPADRIAAIAPPKDHSRRFAIVAITPTLSVWIVLPLLVTLSLAR